MTDVMASGEWRVASGEWRVASGEWRVASGESVRRQAEMRQSASKETMARMDTLQYKAALGIAKTLRDAGHEAVFAGGCVRDMLLGEEVHDFDVATSACPESVQNLFPRTELQGTHFGVVLVIDRDGDERVATEVATYRHDVGYSDGRRPSAVEFSSSAREDVLRRDFTVNGLLLDPFAFEEGKPLDECVLDYVGGREDLRAGVLRAIGDPVKRFDEDKLRMLRAVRFASRFVFEIETHTMRAIQCEAVNIRIVSAERVRDELTKMLTGGHARRAFELLDQSGLLLQVLPEVARMKGVEQPPQYHPEGDVWVHTLMLLEQLPKGAGVTLAWGMLLHDVGKPPTFTPPDPAKLSDRIRFNGHAEIGVAMARSIMSRLKFSNEDCAQIIALVQHHMRFGDVEKMKQSTLKRFLRLPKFDEHLALHHADVTSSHNMLGAYEYARKHFEELGHEEIRPKLLLTGAELIAAGYRPGPRFREMLEAAEDAQLEGLIATQAEALSLVQERFGAADMQSTAS